MPRLSLALLAVATFAAACYKDDATAGINSGNPKAKVFLTDDPFPFDSVQSVQVYVQAAITIPDTGAVIVIDFDVGRSFAYNQRGDGAFDFFPAIRAVNRGATGNIAGTVIYDTSGGPAGPVADATVSAWGGGPNNWYILSTGKTDAAGHYRLAYLLPGTYIVGVEPPSGSNFGSALDSNVAVNKGFETVHNVSLSVFRGDVMIQGASSMLANHTNRLEAFVITPQHQQDTNAPV